MVSQNAIKGAVVELKKLHIRAKKHDPALKQLIDAQDVVMERYQAIFDPSKIDEMSMEDFHSFLLYKNNQHWIGLHRMSKTVCDDIDLLREAVKILLDETRPIASRLNKLVPKGRPNFVKGLSKAILTPILMVVYPDKYAVWNSVSEGAMRQLKVWPEFGSGASFGERYEAINEVQLAIAKELGVDTWVLDALWWRAAKPDETLEGAEEIDDSQDGGSQFAMEKQLHDFLVDNWDSTTLAKEWEIFEQDGDRLAGNEFACDVGFIDILAKHRSEAKWLVIELKKGQTNDKTVGQVLRYKGWVREHLAGPKDEVRGLIISHSADSSLKYALSEVKDVDLHFYEVQFYLHPISFDKK